MKLKSTGETVMPLEQRLSNERTYVTVLLVSRPKTKRGLYQTAHVHESNLASSLD